MKKVNLEDLRYYIYEKQRLEKEIDIISSKISYGVSSPSLEDKGTKAPSSDNATYLLVEKNIKIQNILKKRYKEVVEIIAKMYNIINSIEDAELKQIVELRAIKGMTYEEIAEVLYMSKSNVALKYKRFIELGNIGNDNVL